MSSADRWSEFHRSSEPSYLAGSRCLGCRTPGQCVKQCPDLITPILENGAARVGAVLGTPSVPREVAPLIDHTLLKPDAVRGDVLQLCDEARGYEFASVCVNPTWVRDCAARLRDARVKVCTVIGFPFGATSREVKAHEAKMTAWDGAEELDMVLNIGALKSGDDLYVEQDIRGVVQAAGHNRLVKVILETCYLTEQEKVRACERAVAAGAHFVKTSTGYGPGGATPEDVALMRRVVGSRAGVKAAGGIRDFAKAAQMVQAGASRIGASASVKIVTGEGAASRKY